MRACLLWLTAAPALAGCTTTRYIATPCIAHDQQLPAEPPKVGDQLTGQAQRDFQIVAGSAARLRAWGSSLNDILESCREARPQ